jgi:hypothetical protein
MTDSIKMIDELSHWAADQIAECFSVDDQTYGELWNKCVPLYDDLPKAEVPGEIVYALADYGWDKLSDHAKNEVNRAVAERMAKFA